MTKPTQLSPGTDLIVTPPRLSHVIVPILATVAVIVASVAGSTWWTAQIVSATYHQGFDDGWYRGQRAARTERARKPIQTRIPPEPTLSKTHQPPG